MTDIPFIQRRFDLKPDQTIVVTWYQPEEEDRCWRCRYWIRWPDRDRRFYAAGTDSAQALMLALIMVHVDLLCSDEGKAGQIALNGDLDLDLPLPKSMSRGEFD